MSNQPIDTSAGFAFWIDEPDGSPISNAVLLDSFIEFGAWMRVIQVYEQLKIIDKEAEPVRRLASVASVFTSLGALLEDVACTLLAWMTWRRDRDVLLADILNLITLAPSDKTTQESGYTSTVITSLAERKRTRVDVRRVALELLSLGGVHALTLMGLPWKRQPSVKVARGDELRFWELLPKGLEEVLTVLAADSSRSISTANNKIKHGPQIVLTDLAETFRRAGASTTVVDDFVARIRQSNCSPTTLRILFEGANTSRRKHSAPFLYLDDSGHAIRNLLAIDFYNLAKLPWLIAIWLRKLHFGGTWSTPPAIVLEMEGMVRSHRQGVRPVSVATRHTGASRPH